MPSHCAAYLHKAHNKWAPNAHSLASFPPQLTVYCFLAPPLLLCIVQLIYIYSYRLRVSLGSVR